MIYADNAATTKLRPGTLEAMLPFLQQQYGNPSSTHQAGRAAAQALWNARMDIATCIGAEPRALTFTSGGSESDTLALRSAALYARRSGKTHILSTAFEHHAVLRTLEALEREGFSVTLLDVGSAGTITAQQVCDALRPETGLVSVMTANNEVGSILPIEDIGALCRERGVLFHTDAVQAVGHIPVNVQTQNIDLLSLSGHKFGGPKGVGALYARRDIPLTPLIYGGEQERGHRAGTENVPGIVGMAAALRESCEHMDTDTAHVCALRDAVIAGLSQIPGAHSNGDPKNRLPGTVSFCFDGIDGEALLVLLDEMGICASSGSACAAGALEPSHVLLAMGISPALARSALRLSLSAETTETEVNEIIAAVTDSVARLRGQNTPTGGTP